MCGTDLQFRAHQGELAHRRFKTDNTARVNFNWLGTERDAQSGVRRSRYLRRGARNWSGSSVRRLAYEPRARSQSRRFRRVHAIALGAALLLIVANARQETATAMHAQAGSVAQDTSATERVQEAARPLLDVARSAGRFLPRLLIAVGLLAAAALLARLIRPLLQRVLKHLERAQAITALVLIGVWILAIGAALSVLAGDARVLVGSVGLIGLALSWSLQTPIESFTGWLLNSFRGYYRVGDRIAVGDVFGDVYAVDVLTTTVWEAGGPGKPVAGAQPTGALITFPNSEVLRTNIVNYTRDFPFVWDELTVGIRNDSDIAEALRLFSETAACVLGAAMTAPATTYQQLLRDQELDYDVAVEPQVFLTLRDAWTDLTIRYLVPARERRIWSSDLARALNDGVARNENVRLAYPRHQIELITESSDGT